MTIRQHLVALVIVLTSTTTLANHLIADGPADQAPVEVQQFGQLVGDWVCTQFQPDQDGKWVAQAGLADWSFYYVLDGFAVQDVWRPRGNAAPMGTNLRTFDPASGRWQMVWATTVSPRFESFEAIGQGNDIVMFGRRQATATAGEHLAKITFHNITEQRFDWRYESTTIPPIEPWGEVFRIRCERPVD